MTVNKYVSSIEEFKSLKYDQNNNINVTFEIVNGEEGDINQYIRVSNSGSIDVTLTYGIQNLIQ